MVALWVFVFALIALWGWFYWFQVVGGGWCGVMGNYQKCSGALHVCCAGDRDSCCLVEWGKGGGGQKTSSPSRLFALDLSVVL